MLRSDLFNILPFRQLVDKRKSRPDNERVDGKSENGYSTTKGGEACYQSG